MHVSILDSIIRHTADQEQLQYGQVTELQAVM